MSDKAKKLYCRRCQGETNHIERGAHSSRSTIDEGHNWEEITYRLWTCAGCDKAVMETESSASHFVDDEGNLQYSSSYDPEASEGDLKPKVFRKMPVRLRTIYSQTIVANLHGFRFMGNIALHELAAPKKDDLKVAIEVSEDLLNFLYELDYKASLLPQKPDSAQGKSGVQHGAAPDAAASLSRRLPARVSRTVSPMGAIRATDMLNWTNYGKCLTASAAGLR